MVEIVASAPAEKWKQVQQIFLAVADLSADRRTAALEEMCSGDAALRAEVESLLAAEHGGEVLVGGEGSLQTAIRTEAAFMVHASGREGSRVGAYRLIREIGRGGMGTVYLALRADEQYESEVAIKLVRPALDTDFILRRFRRERQILANLQHPNIARLLDAGTTEDQVPYLVMEYVKGSWINHYAAEHNLSVEDRLRLFLQVCAAVSYVHRALIIHRDLKPANILIDSAGVPKLLDFGISKLLRAEPVHSAETQGMGLMTPDYASPEQIVGDPVTVASDVYSLGAVLYELLTGQTPHRIDQATPLALERAICLDPTIAPSSAVGHNRVLARRLAGDLDTIILCAMRKDPERRYASVEHLAQDLQRHLEHRPLVARPDSPLYRASKFVRRNALSIVLAGSIAAASVGVVAATICQARTSQQAAKREMAQTQLQLGDLYLTHGDRVAAAASYRRALAAAETVLSGKPGDDAAQRLRLEADRKLKLAQGSSTP